MPPKNRDSGGIQTLRIPGKIDSRIRLLVSPDCRRVAYAVHKSSGMHVEVNGRASNYVDAVFSIDLTDQAMAFVGTRRGRVFAVFNDVEHDAWDDIGKTGAVISPNSQRIAYTACRANQWFAVIDGLVVGGPYEGFSPGGILFSPDSRRFAYVVKRGNSWLAVVDGQEHRAYPTIMQRSLTFSPDSSRIAYVAALDGQWVGDHFVGEEAPILDQVPQQVWRCDGTSTSNQFGLSEELYFSPDSKRFAYSGTHDGRSFVVVDGTRQGDYDGLNSGRVAFRDSGKVGAKSNKIVWSPDSQHVAYAAGHQQQQVLMLDGRETGRYQAILNPSILFSPDSARLAYGIEEGRAQRVVLDGNSLPAYDGLPPIQWSFSPDSSRLAYGITVGASRQSLIVGRQIFQLDGGFVIDAALIWDSNAHLHSIISQGNQIQFLMISV